MKYVIDEEELKEYAEYCGWRFESMVKVLNLKSKTPVEEIAEEEVTGFYVGGNINGIYLGRDDNERFYYTTAEQAINCQGKKVKIYIEVIK